MLAILLFAGISLFGQSPDTIKLKEVIISGEVQSVQKTLIPKHLLSGTNPNIADALNQIPGFFKVQANNYSITYRGQYGNRLRIEQNGNRRSGVTPEGGYFAEDINPSDVNEVRVVNGAEKAIFGSGSSGGVIQMNEVSDFEKGRSSNHQIYAAYADNNQNRILGFSSRLIKSKLIFRLSGRHQNANDYQIPDGTTINNSASRQNNLSFKLLIKDQNNQHLWDISQQISEGLWNRPQGFQNNPLELRSFQNNQNLQTTVKLSSNINAQINLTNRASLLILQTDQVIRNFNPEMTDINVERIRTYNKRSFDYEGAAEFKANNQTSLKGGIDLYYSSLEELNSESNFIDNTFTENELVDERLDYQGGIFGLMNRQINKLAVTATIRLDIARIGNRDQLTTFSAATGGIDLSWALTDHLKSTWSAGRFFRYPTQQEAVGEFFGGRGIFLGNPDIKPEYSHQLDWTIGGVKSKFSYQLTGWFHHFNGRISPIPTGDGEFTYENVENASIAGSECVVSYQTNSYKNQYTITFTGTAMKGDVLAENSLTETIEPLIGIPPARVRLLGTIKRKMGKNNTVSTEVVIEKLADFDRLPDRFINQTFAVVPTDGYLLLNAGVAFTHLFEKNRFTLSFRGTNLSNTAYFPFGTRVLDMGRNLRFSVKYQF